MFHAPGIMTYITINHLNGLVQDCSNSTGVTAVLHKAIDIV